MLYKDDYVNLLIYLFIILRRAKKKRIEDFSTRFAKSAYRDYPTLGVAPQRCPYPQIALQI